MAPNERQCIFMNKRTSFITAGAVTGVLLAGIAAVGANIGILNAADNGNVGDLNAVVTVTTPPETIPTSVEPQVIDVYVEEPANSTPAATTPSSTAPQVDVQDFVVDDAGTVSVESTESGVLLDGVALAEGWTWISSQSAEGELEVTITSADSEYVFTASLFEDGTIVARVDELIVNVVRAPAASAPSNTAGAGGQNSTVGEYGDDDEYDEYDDDEYEDDEYDDEDEYEDDDHDEDEEDDHDDHDEYEGADDDD